MPTSTFTSKAEYAANFRLCEQEMATFAAAVRDSVKAGLYTADGLWKRNQDAKGGAIFQVRRVLEAIAALAKQDRATAEDVLDGPEPLQSAETLAALAYQQVLLLRRFAPGDFSVLGALADAVEDGDAVKAQVLADLAEGLPWSIESIGKMEQADRLRRRAIELRADPPRKAALAALALLDGDRETAGVDGKVEAIGYAVGQRCESILRESGDDQMVGSFKLDWVTPQVGSRGGAADYLGTLRMLGVVPPLTR